MAAKAAADNFNNALAAHAAGRHAEAVRMLQQASEAGHVAAMTLLGGQLLSGRGAPPDPAAGTQLILRAADLGGGQACAMAAAVTAAGVASPPEWTRALDYLQRGAELGYGGAQDQLRFLSGSHGNSPSWAQLRRGVSVERWRVGPKPRTLMADPTIRVVESFVSPAVCDWIIAKARDNLRPAEVFDGQAVRPVKAEGRTNSAAGFDLVNADVVVLLVRERLAATFGYDASAMEAPQLLHYAVGQQFAPHFDFLDDAIPAYAQSVAALGQRFATLLVYLNQDYEGGETDFPKLEYRFRGRTGDALMFANTDANGQADRRMLHAGLSPTAGEKWVLSQWVRGRSR